MTNLMQAVDLLRALGEATRYRLLALLRHGELTVGEIAEAVCQSQPRISRHLKLLSDAGVLERFREEQRTYYRLANGGVGGGLTAYLLQQLDAQDAQLDRDRRQLNGVLEKRARSASAKWEDARRSAESTYADVHIVASLLKEVGADSWNELLDVGTGTGSMLKLLGARAKHAVGLDISTHALRVARAKVHGSGLNHCEFRRGDMYDLPFVAGTFDAVTLDHVLASAERPAVVIREAVRTLRKGGKIIIVEDSERLAEAVKEKPQTILRRWSTRAGAHCEKIKSIHSERARLVLAIGRRE